MNRKMFGLLVGTALLASVGVASAEDQASGAGHDFALCEGEFALCAASTCTPTGGSITVNVTAGGTASFPEADCTCPVLSGLAIADLTGGNMKGSCEPPPGQIWSTYSPRRHIPQAITGWSRQPAQTLAPPQICPASLNLGDQMVNCFSFACDPAGEVNGVQVATCHCALGESLDGTPVLPNTAFGTQAGQGDQAICAEHPVAGPLPPGGTPNNEK